MVGLRGADLTKKTLRIARVEARQAQLEARLQAGAANREIAQFDLEQLDEIIRVGGRL
jgi:hypothetical protein